MPSQPVKIQYNIYIDNSTHVSQGDRAYEYQQPYTLLQPGYHYPSQGYPVQQLTGPQQIAYTSSGYPQLQEPTYQQPQFDSHLHRSPLPAQRRQNTPSPTSTRQMPRNPALRLQAPSEEDESGGEDDYAHKHHRGAPRVERSSYAEDEPAQTSPTSRRGNYRSVTPAGRQRRSSLVPRFLRNSR